MGPHECHTQRMTRRSPAPPCITKNDVRDHYLIMQGTTLWRVIGQSNDRRTTQMTCDAPRQIKSIRCTVADCNTRPCKPIFRNAWQRGSRRASATHDNTMQRRIIRGNAMMRTRCVMQCYAMQAVVMRCDASECETMCGNTVYV